MSLLGFGKTTNRKFGYSFGPIISFGGATWDPWRIWSIPFPHGLGQLELCERSWSWFVNVKWDSPTHVEGSSVAEWMWMSSMASPKCAGEVERSMEQGSPKHILPTMCLT